MTDTSHGTGGLTFDKTKRSWPNEMNILFALIIILVIFEILGQILPYMNNQSFLFDTRGNFDSIFNEARLQIIILQVAIIGIIALGVTQVIITAGIDLSSGPLVAATAMIAMSFAQTELVNGNPNPKAIFGTWAMDLPVLVPVVVGLLFGAMIGCINGTFVAYFRIPPFIATLGMFLICRGIALWWSAGRPVSFPTESYKFIGSGMMPVVWFLSLAVLFHIILRYTVYGKHTYAIGSNEEAARMSGINVRRHKVLVYMIASHACGIRGRRPERESLNGTSWHGGVLRAFRHRHGGHRWHQFDRGPRIDHRHRPRRNGARCHSFRLYLRQTGRVISADGHGRHHHRGGDPGPIPPAQPCMSQETTI